MQSRLNEIRAANAQVLAISVDSVETNKKLADALGLEFPVLADEQLEAIDAYDLRHEAARMDGNDIARPAVFILDRNGVVQWRDLTDNWRVRVRPEGILKELGAIS